MYVHIFGTYEEISTRMKTTENLKTKLHINWLVL